MWQSVQLVMSKTRYSLTTHNSLHTSIYGVVEIMNRTLMEKARRMLSGAGVA